MERRWMGSAENKRTVLFHSFLVEPFLWFLETAVKSKEAW